MLILFILLLALISILQDLMIRHQLKKAFPQRPWIHRIYLTSVLTLDILIVIALVCYRRAPDADSPRYVQIIMWVIAIFMMSIIPKLVYLLISLIDYPISWMKKRRVYWFSTVGLVVGLYCLSMMIYGATRGRKHIEIKEITITSNKLPATFDGYRIVLFSDLHIGNYGPHNTLIKRMVEKVNDLNADLVVNCGDIVTTNARELSDKDMATLASILSRDGIYSVFGNHDLGFYMRERSGFRPEESIKLLEKKQAQMGWHLLNNQSTAIHRGADSIMISGVNYPQDGFHNGRDTGLGGCDLESTYRNVPDGMFDILISHTPQNWDTIRAVGKADLTLSGHVHAMQIKIRFGNWVWSPAKWMYPRWSGLYTEDGKYLYVNDGMGYVIYPMRIGTYPELTLITLRCGTNAQSSDRLVP